MAGPKHEDDRPVAAAVKEEPLPVAGDTVTLKVANAPPMTVHTVYPEQKTCRCQWFDPQGVLQEQVFALALLKPGAIR